MSVEFSLTSKTRSDVFKAAASIDDKTTYKFDCTAWEEDNETITDATWTVERGAASVSNQSVLDGVVLANIQFSQAGKTLITILLETATLQKKLWLEIGVKDNQRYADDYGYCT